MIKSFKEIYRKWTGWSNIAEGAVTNMGRIYQHSKESNVAIMSAHRGEFDEAGNIKRYNQLKAEIQQAKFGYVPMNGHYIENYGSDEARNVQEKVFFIISSKGDKGRLKAFVQKMGAKYTQDSVLYKDADSDDAIIIGTTSGVWPGKGVEVVAGKFGPNKIGQFYTRMRNNKTFVFESVEFPETLISRAYRERAEKNSKIIE